MSERKGTAFAVLMSCGVLSFIAAAIAFGIAQSNKTKADHARVTDVMVDSILGRTGDHPAVAANMAPAIILAVVGVVLITWALIMRAGQR